MAMTSKPHPSNFFEDARREIHGELFSRSFGIMGYDPGGRKGLFFLFNLMDSLSTIVGFLVAVGGDPVEFRVHMHVSLHEVVWIDGGDD